MTDERVEALMVRVVDEVATPAEREELMAHLASHPELAEELQMHTSLKAVTDGWVRRLELDLAEDRSQRDPVTHVWWTLGLALAGLGTAALVGGGLSELLLDPTVPLWARAGTALLVGGAAVLLAAAVRWRLQTRTHDAYTEVIR